ncbi:MAG: alanine--tRNA ligase, partial [Nitrospinae bacterium]|nr:alanine--tRNA ligase [Nitrospinota bacterium]
MKPMTGADVRRAFLDYFAARGHTEVRSSPLAPGNDPTLLFTNAGMVQFKDVFLGADRRPYVRATTSQKCLRVSGKHNDLETVGRTARHHTFFEMLGNFSFGDYFKREAITFAWEFITKVMGIPTERLYATVYLDDDEAAALWAEISGLPPERIQRFGEKDNFWSMGETGPCGPCAEIHYDRGPEHACDNPACGIDCECDRFLEIWNLVFMQYDRGADGTLTPLPKPSVDTGMGLERLVSVIQGKNTNYETDLLYPVIEAMVEIAKKPYLADPETTVSYRVIADHVRAASFLIAEQIMPGADGRGYVLRRILRRALRHGRMLGIKGPFAHALTGTVVDMMGDAYPELAEYREIIHDVVLAEEQSFGATLDHGMKLIAEMIDAAKATGTIPGEEAFKLYDTFGFPMDLAVEIAADAKVSIDMAGFEAAMQAQREKARSSWKGGGNTTVSPVYGEAAGNAGPTPFLGYAAAVADATVLGLVADGKLVNEAGAGTTLELLLDKTPFYAESGGQVADGGVIENESCRMRVTDVRKPDGRHIFHTVTVETGSIRKGAAVTARVDAARNGATRRNHSATHLLHAALRATLGGHVKQAGSQVGPEKLRFDYTHFTAPAAEELALIERAVNEQILANAPVVTDEKSVDEAVASGAMALFGEKYGEKVRVVSMGDYSKELCGGAHAKATGDIGLFRIVSESALAAGVRRIEGVTGVGAYDYALSQERELKRAADTLKAPPMELTDRVKKLADKLRDMERENRTLKEKLVAGDKGGTLRTETVDGVTVVYPAPLDGADGEAL